MPLGKYKNFAACKAAKKKEGLSEKSASKYCGKLYWKVHGKKKGIKLLKHEIMELKKELQAFSEKYISQRTTENYIRKRRFSPSLCVPGKIKTKDLGDGKKAIVCLRKDTKKWDAQSILIPRKKKGNK